MRKYADRYYSPENAARAVRSAVEFVRGYPISRGEREKILRAFGRTTVRKAKT